MQSMYNTLGISAPVYQYGEDILRDLRERFDAIDQVACANSSV